MVAKSTKKRTTSRAKAAKETAAKAIEETKETVEDVADAVTLDEPATAAEDVIEDAATTSDDAVSPSDDVPEAEAADADAKATEDVQASEQATSDEPASEDAAAPSGEADTPQADDTPKEPTPAAEPQQVTTIVEKKSGGFFPLLLGGVAAAAIGFGMARYVLPEGWPIGSTGDDSFELEMRASLEAQAAKIAELEAQLASGVARPEDVSALDSPIAEASAAAASALETAGGVQDAVAGLQDSLTALDTRLTDLEKRPIAEGVSDEAIAAYERELAALQESVAAQRAEIETIADEASAKQEEADQLAQVAAMRAAATQVATAVTEGKPFADALGAFTEAGGTDVPAELSDAAQSGVPTLASLQEDFPAAARAALSAARSAAPAEESEGGAGGLGTFLARQLGARSVTPREGDSPDAVLSRAEAAVRDGSIAAALTEIETLPDAAKDALASWAEAAGTRASATAAAEALLSRLGEN